MNKLFLSIAACALTLSSCSTKIEIDEPINDFGNTLAFTTGVGTSTKAAEMELDGLKTAVSGPGSSADKGKFIMVNLFETGTNTGYENEDTPSPTIKDLSELRLVWQNNRWNMWRKNGGIWTEDNNILYHLTKGADFYSYHSPLSVSGTANPILTHDMTTSHATLQKFTYTVGNVYAKAFNQEDLLVANKVVDQKQGKVTLAFKHALSQINFALKDDDRYVFYISEIEAMNVIEKATWDFTANNWGIPTYLNDTKGYNYLMDGTYTINGVANSMAASRGWESTIPGYVKNDNNTVANTPGYKNLNNGFSLDEGSVGDTYVKAEDAAYRKAQYKKGNNGLMLMPQELKQNAQRMRIRVYKVEKGGSTTINSKSYDFTTENSDKGKDFYVDFCIPENIPTAYENKWKNGLRYLYILDMASIVGLDNYISFDVQVTEWENYDFNGTNTGEVGITNLTLYSLPLPSTVGGYQSSQIYEQPASVINLSNNSGFDLSNIDFTNLSVDGYNFVLDYSKVQFTAGGTGFSIALKPGYVIAEGATAVAAQTAAATATDNYLYNYHKSTANNTNHFVCIMKATTTVTGNQKPAYAKADVLKAKFAAASAGDEFHYVGNASDIDVATWNPPTITGTITIVVKSDAGDTTSPAGVSGDWSWVAGTKTLTYTKL